MSPTDGVTVVAEGAHGARAGQGRVQAAQLHGSHCETTLGGCGWLGQTAVMMPSLPHSALTQFSLGLITSSITALHCPPLPDMLPSHPAPARII